MSTIRSLASTEVLPHTVIWCTDCNKNTGCIWIKNLVRKKKIRRFNHSRPLEYVANMYKMSYNNIFFLSRDKLSLLMSL